MTLVRADFAFPVITSSPLSTKHPTFRTKHPGIADTHALRCIASKDALLSISMRRLPAQAEPPMNVWIR